MAAHKAAQWQGQGPARGYYRRRPSSDNRSATPGGSVQGSPLNLVEIQGIGQTQDSVAVGTPTCAALEVRQAAQAEPRSLGQCFLRQPSCLSMASKQISEQQVCQG